MTSEPFKEISSFTKCGFMFPFTFLILSLLTFAASAQDGLNGCIDYTGSSIPTVYSGALPTVAMAEVSPENKSRILLNPKMLARHSNVLQTFIYWHECGHHVLGHLFKRIPTTIIQEQEADCIGIRVPVTLGLIKLTELPSLQREVANLGPGSWQHFPGSTRAANLEKCLGRGLAHDVWNSCKIRYYSTIDFIKETLPALNQILDICLRFGTTSTQCKEARQMTNKLDDGIKKSVGMLDEECPFVVDPVFNKIVAEYSKKLVRLRNLR